MKKTHTFRLRLFGCRISIALTRGPEPQERPSGQTAPTISVDPCAPTAAVMNGL